MLHDNARLIPCLRTASGCARTERASPEHVVQWQVVAALTSSPKVVVFSSQRRAARFLLRAGDGRAFRVLKVECASAGVLGRPASAEPGSTQVVEVKLDGQTKLDGGRGVLSVQIDHPAVKIVEVPLLILD